MKIRSVFLVVFLGTVAVAGRFGAGQVAQPAHSRAVTLDVVVTDKKDAPVADLKAEDFKVLDNKTAQTIASLRPVVGADAKADPATEVILLVDMVNSPVDALAVERKNIEDFLRERGGHLVLPTSLVFLTTTELKFQGKATLDGNVLIGNIENNPTVQRMFQPQGGFQDAVQIRQKSLEALNGLAMKLNERPGRKLVIWISPGWWTFPNLTHQKSAQEMDVLFNYIVGLTTLLREARITLYSVDPRGAERDLSATSASTYYKEYIKGVPTPKQADNGNLFLQAIATQTGGRVLYGGNNVAGRIDECIADAQTFYELTYDVPAAAHANEYHGIEVQVNRPKVEARTVTGFYAQP